MTSRAVLGKSVTTAEAWRDARPQLPKLFGLTFLLPLIAITVGALGTLPGILVGLAGGGDGAIALAVFGGLAAAVVALWLMIRFSLASPALMLEKQSVFKSMSRSAKLVRGSWWRVFGIQLLATIIANIVASIIVIPFAFLASALSGDGVTGFLNSGTGDLGWTFLIISGDRLGDRLHAHVPDHRRRLRAPLHRPAHPPRGPRPRPGPRGRRPGIRLRGPRLTPGS